VVAPLFRRKGLPLHKFPAPLPSTPINNVGPQGGLGPKTLIIPGNRPGLYWYDTDELAAQAVVVVDEDAWVNPQAAPYIRSPQAFFADGDDWIPSIPIDEDYHWRAQTCPDYPILKGFSADEDVLPRLNIDEDYWLIGQYQPHAFAKAVIADEDVWIASIGFDEDLPSLPKVSLQWAYQKASSDDDSFVPAAQPFGLDDDYWSINRYTLYAAPLQAFIADGDDWIASIPVDEDLPWIPKFSPQWILSKPFISDDDVWVPVPIAPPNLHRLVMDINTGRLGWMISGTTVSSPILIDLFD
jgi:hypothetical protein